jgi:hypothetical protein
LDSRSRCRNAAAWAAAVLLSAASCDLPRDNPLDPRNPHSQRPKRILLEAFVNLHTGQPYDAYAVEALDSLESVYGNRIAIIEYHRNVGDKVTPYHRSENDILYGNYLEAAKSDRRGAPDVFVDGPGGRVQGASSAASVFRRIQQLLLADLPEPGLFTVEARLAVTSGELRPTVTVARLGSSDASGIRIRAVVTARMDDALQKRVAAGFTESAAIGTLRPGETRTVTLPSIPVDARTARECTVLVTDDGTGTVYQCETFPVGSSG